MAIKFEWDEAKRQSNLRKHGIDFRGIEEVFDGLTVTVVDDRFDYGEERFVTFGLLEGRVVAVAHLENSRVIRIISVRTSTKYEENEYFKEIAN